MTETDLVTLAPDGSVVAGHREPSSEHRVHVAVYAARPDAQAIVHTHSVHATAWSLLGEPLDTGTEELEHAGRRAGPDRRLRPHRLGRDRRAVRGGARGPARACCSAATASWRSATTPAAALVTCQSVERQAQIAWLLRGSGSP